MTVSDGGRADGDPGVVLVDEPAARVRRFTLNRPEKRNALSNELRLELFEGLRAGDRDPDVSVMIVRGGGSCFSAGYDLRIPSEAVERSTAMTDGWWSRHVVAGWFELWDMSTPLIAQVHGYCLAGGTELAAACDLVYVSDDAEIGYPPVRLMSPPDLAWQPWLLGMRRAMEALLTGDAMTGTEAVEAGFAKPSLPRGRARRRRGPGCGTDRQDPLRPLGAQQAGRPPCDGGVGDASGSASDGGHPGPRVPPAGVSRLPASARRR